MQIHDVISAANVLLTRLRNAEALALYETAIREAPGDERGYCGAVLALVCDGRPQDAVGYLERLAEIMPGEAYPHGAMGTVLDMAGRGQDAMACYEKAQEMDPGDLSALAKMASAMSRAGRDEECAQAVMEILRAKPRDRAAAEVQEIVAGIVSDRPDKSKLGADLPPSMVPGMVQMLDVLFGDAGAALASDIPRLARGRPKRNSPCPCGSGKKYKRCCMPE